MRTNLTSNGSLFGQLQLRQSSKRIALRKSQAHIGCNALTVSRAKRRFNDQHTVGDTAMTHVDICLPWRYAPATFSTN